MNYQFIKYVRSRGIDPYTLNATQRQELKSDMIRDLYPGENTVVASLEHECMTTSNHFRAGQVARNHSRHNDARREPGDGG